MDNYKTRSKPLAQLTGPVTSYRSLGCDSIHKSSVKVILIKVKSCPCAHREGVWGNGGTAALILHHRTAGRCKIGLAITPRGKNPLYQLNTTLVRL